MPQNWVWWLTPAFPAPGRLRREDFREFKANLGHRMSFASLPPTSFFPSLSKMALKRSKLPEEEVPRDDMAAYISHRRLLPETSPEGSDSQMSQRETVRGPPGGQLAGRND